MCLTGCTRSDDPGQDSTPVRRVVQPCPERNFVILLGAPGKYNPADQEHDRYWGNYFVAAQHIFGAGSGQGAIAATETLFAEECTHWLVYEKAYAQRWTTDKASGVAFLIAEANKYPSGYQSRVQEYVKGLGARHKYVAVDSYKDLWETLYNLPDDSLTRLWYFGHGNPDLFFLRYSTANTRYAEDHELLKHSAMTGYASWLKAKAKASDGKVSKFYSCHSRDWAKAWHDTTELKSEGSGNKVAFNDIRTGGGLSRVVLNSSWETFP